MRKALFIATCVSMVIAYAGITNGFAQTTGGQTGTKTITTAVPFLNIGPDSRAGGMGEVGVAVADDANAQHWNPAALSFIDNRLGLSMSYSPWLRALGIPDINLAYLSSYFKVAEMRSIWRIFSGWLTSLDKLDVLLDLGIDSQKCSAVNRG